MRRSAFALLLLLPLAACSQPAPIQVEDVWARDTVGRVANAAVFMTITSPVADRLVGASAPVANKTDLMTMQNTDDAMRMIYLEAIDIPAGEPVFLEPAGLHVWLAELKAPLVNGTSFPLTLRFENAGEKQVRVAVIGPADTPPMAGMEM